MKWKRLKWIKDIKDLEIYNSNIYISKTFIYKFIEKEGVFNQCEKCFFGKYKEVGCSSAPCGFKGGFFKKDRKDKKTGYFKLVGDLTGEIVETKDMLIDGLERVNEKLQNAIKLHDNKRNPHLKTNIRVYLSGPVTALIDAGREQEAIAAFSMAEQNLKALGFEVVNPCNNGIDLNDKWIKHIIKDIELEDTCQAICYLHNYDLFPSPGGQMEKIVARREKKMEIRETLIDGIYNYIQL
jgi:hypothetical protein